jgi:hypothetical protein
MRVTGAKKFPISQLPVPEVWVIAEVNETTNVVAPLPLEMFTVCSVLLRLPDVKRSDTGLLAVSGMAGVPE